MHVVVGARQGIRSKETRMKTFFKNRKWEVGATLTGLAGGAAWGARIGGGVGLVAGPAGGMAGTVPGAIIGGMIGALSANKIGSEVDRARSAA